METFLLKPEMFNYYIAFDPSLWWNNNYLVKIAKQKLASFTKEEKRIWFACSSAKDISEHTKELADIFKTENLSNIDWKYSPEPNEKHNTIFRATKENAIIWAIGRQ